MKFIFRSLLVLIVIVAVTAFAWAQPKSAAQWSISLSPAASRVGDEVEVILIARLSPGWIVYSSDFEAEIGPQPTRLVLTPSDAYTAAGPLISVQPRRKTERIWDLELGYFAQRAEFRQRIKILRENFRVEGVVKGQLCSETDGTCSLFTEKFSVAAK